MCSSIFFSSKNVIIAYALHVKILLKIVFKIAKKAARNVIRIINVLSSKMDTFKIPMGTPKVLYIIIKINSFLYIIIFIIIYLECDRSC